MWSQITQGDSDYFLRSNLLVRLGNPGTTQNQILWQSEPKGSESLFFPHWFESLRGNQRIQSLCVLKLNPGESSEPSVQRGCVKLTSGSASAVQ